MTRSPARRSCVSAGHRSSRCPATTTTTSTPAFRCRPDLVDGLRENSILYDRDEQGEFLHFFTEMLGSRVFFEVVQRIDGYAGFGDPHSVPLRMAAHRRQRLRMLASAPTESSSEHRHDYSLAHLTALSLSPPELVDAAAAAGYRYVGLRMTKVTARGAALPADVRPGTDAGHEDTSRGDRHRGPRHRARAHSPPETARATTCASWRPAPSSERATSSRSCRIRTSHARPIDSPSCASSPCPSA